MRQEIFHEAFAELWRVCRMMHQYHPDHLEWLKIRYWKFRDQMVELGSGWQWVMVMDSSIQNKRVEFRGNSEKSEQQPPTSQNYMKGSSRVAKVMSVPMSQKQSRMIYCDP